MACDLIATELAACESGIGKIDSQTRLLRLIAQLSCEISDAGGGGGGGGTPALPFNSVQFNNAGAFGGSADLTFDDATNILALAGRETIANGTANTTSLALTGYSLTGANAQSMVSLAGTWNTTGVPTAIDLDITNTASAATSLLMDLRTGGTSRFSVRVDGRVTAPSAIINTIISTGILTLAATTTISLESNGSTQWVVNGTIFTAAGMDIGFSRSGVGVLEINEGTTPGAFRDVRLRSLLTNNAAAIVTSQVAMTSGPGASVGTLTDAPSAGNADVWCPIVLNGTTYWFPCWSL